MTIELFLIATIVGIGGFMQGFAGFGLALIVVPLLSTIIDVRIAIPVAGIFAWFVSAPLVLKMHTMVQWKIVFILVAGALPGAFVGAECLKRLSATITLTGLGFLIIASSLYALSGHQKLIEKNSKRLTVSVGFFSGFLGAGVGASGPPVIAYTSMLPWKSDQIKATIVAFFMLQMFGTMFSFWTKGLLTPEVGFYVLRALPGFIIGVILGVSAYQFVVNSQINFRRIIHGILLLMGIILVMKNLVQ